MMSMSQAMNIAELIGSQRPRWLILSIGRYLPPAEVRVDSPWGVCVMPPGAEKPRVLWSREEFEQLCASAKDNETNNKRPAAKVSGPALAAGPATEPAVAGMLF